MHWSCIVFVVHGILTQSNHSIVTCVRSVDGSSIDRAPNDIYFYLSAINKRYLFHKVS